MSYDLFLQNVRAAQERQRTQQCHGVLAFSLTHPRYCDAPATRLVAGYGYCDSCAPRNVIPWGMQSGGMGPNDDLSGGM